MSTKKSAQEQTEELDAREKALASREEALDQDLKKMNFTRKYLREFDASSVGAAKSLTLSEIGEGKGIELMTDPYTDVSMEAFMHEPVMINIYPDGTQGALEVVVITVNGINQAIIRGKDQVVKRKYVEALARSRITNYQQEVADPSRPESIQMKPIAALTYPFTVREDRNPRGKSWLEGILRQPM